MRFRGSDDKRNLANLWQHWKVGVFLITVEYGHSVVLISLCRDIPWLENNKQHHTLFTPNDFVDMCSLQRGLSLRQSVNVN